MQCKAKTNSGKQCTREVIAGSKYCWQHQPNTGNVGGRTTKYDPLFIEKVAHWARDGLIDEEIATRLGISPSTLYEWKNKFPEFSEALKKNKEITDYTVEDSLLQRALGYEYNETTHERRTDPATGEPELVVTKVVTKQVVPDTTAQIFWLKNRQPKKWRDKQEIDHNLNVNNPFSGLTTEELRKLVGLE